MAQVDNGQKIAITPAVCDDLPLPENAKRALGQKLLQMATQNGFGASAGAFVLTANVNTVDKIMSGTIPAQFIVDLEVSVYIVNLTENIIAAETSPDANVIWGVNFDEELEDEMRITIIATGFADRKGELGKATPAPAPRKTEAAPAPRPAKPEAPKKPRATADEELDRLMMEYGTPRKKKTNR